MTYWKRAVNSLVSALILAGCSASIQAPGSAAASVLVSTSSQAIYSRMAPLLAATNLATWRATPLYQVYADAVAKSSDDTIQISDLGTSVSGQRSKLLAAQAAIGATAKLYPTLGDLADASLISPPHTLTEAEFRRALQSLTMSDADLGLTGAAVPGQTTPVPNRPYVFKLGQNTCTVRFGADGSRTEQYANSSAPDQNSMKISHWSTGTDIDWVEAGKAPTSSIFTIPRYPGAKPEFSQEGLNQLAAGLVAPYWNYDEKDNCPEDMDQSTWENM